MSGAPLFVITSCLHRPEACPQLITAHLQDLLGSRTPWLAPGQPSGSDVAERSPKQRWLRTSESV